MTPADLLTDLRRRDVTVWTEGDRLSFDGPEGAVTPALIELLRESKPALLAILEAEQLAAYGLGRCARCRRIVTVRHLAEAASGRAVCTDYADCMAAKEQAAKHAKEEADARP